MRFLVKTISHSSFRFLLATFKTQNASGFKKCINSFLESIIIPKKEKTKKNPAHINRCMKHYRERKSFRGDIMLLSHLATLLHPRTQRSLPFPSVSFPSPPLPHESLNPFSAKSHHLLTIASKKRKVSSRHNKSKNRSA